MSNIHIYSDCPTAGGIDGARLDSSVQGSYGDLIVTLNASISESKSVKMAVRTDENYYIDGVCSLSISGENADKWAILINHEYDSLSSVDEYLDSLDWSSNSTLSDVDSNNSIFWLKAISSDDELPSLSGGVNFTVNGLVASSISVE